MPHPGEVDAAVIAMRIEDPIAMGMLTMVEIRELAEAALRAAENYRATERRLNARAHQN